MNYKSPAIHRTPLYRAKSAYAGMQARCLNRNGKNPTYAEVELRMSLEQWLEWSVPLYKKFEARFPGQVPTVSRIGDKGHYEIGNIQLWPSQWNKKRNDVPKGKKWCSDCKKPCAIAEFCKNRSRRDGLATQCRSCMKERYQRAASVQRSSMSSF